jgi:hypothetical protein
MSCSYKSVAWIARRETRATSPLRALPLNLWVYKSRGERKTHTTTMALWTGVASLLFCRRTPADGLGRGSPQGASRREWRYPFQETQRRGLPPSRPGWVGLLPSRLFPKCAHAALPSLTRERPLPANGALPGRIRGTLNSAISPGWSTRFN